jgi:hypothetical protein
MASNTRPEHLTSTNVELLKTTYTEFKKINKINKITIGKLLNRAMTLYVNDGDFKKKIDNFNDLMIFDKNF